MSYSSGSLSFVLKDKVIFSALLVSLAFHGIPIFGVTFMSGTSPAAMMQEVVDVISQDPQQKKKADFIAADNQQGQGSAAEKLKLESPDRSPANANEMNITLDTKNSEKQQTAEQYMQRYLRTTLSYEKVKKETKNKSKDKESNDSKESEDRIMAQIATLEAQFARRQQTLARQTKVKTVTSSVDTKKSAQAAFVSRFKKRVEQIGNAHYPAVARAQNITGDVRLMVIVSAKGEVKAIRMTKSSGSSLLDKFAKATVRQAAPFGEFTKGMGDLHELRIIRTWRFTDKETVTTLADSEVN